MTTQNYYNLVGEKSKMAQKYKHSQEKNNLILIVKIT